MRKTLTMLAVAAFVVAGAGAAQASLIDGLVSYWNFDGSLTDFVGGHNGTYVGDTSTTYAAGKFGAGVLLDGNTEHIQINDEWAYDFGAPDNGMSISAWFRVDAYDTGWQALIAKGEGNEFRLARNGGGSSLAWVGGGPDLTAGPNVNDGGLHHVVVTSSGGSPDGIEIWIDGAMANSSSPVNGIVDNNQPLMIGENPDAQNREWEGMIDDVAIWGRPLTSDEILRIWGDGEGPALQHLIPEPTTLTLVGLGLLGLARKRRRR